MASHDRVLFHTAHRVWFQFCLVVRWTGYPVIRAISTQRHPIMHSHQYVYTPLTLTLVDSLRETPHYAAQTESPDSVWLASSDVPVGRELWEGGSPAREPSPGPMATMHTHVPTKAGSTPSNSCSRVAMILVNSVKRLVSSLQFIYVRREKIAT